MSRQPLPPLKPDAAPITMVDLRGQHAALKQEILQAMAQVLDSGRYILGPNVEAFEREAAAYLGAREAVAVASGTDALYLSLVAAGIGAGDEVITTPFSFIATATAIRFAGARPVFVDIDPVTYNIDPAAIEQAVTPATCAIIPVHLYGQPANLEAIKPICKRYDLALIEDCAQSFGARRGAGMTGSIGLTGCFSFYPSKNLGGIGDGGLIVTSSEEMAQHLRRLRNHGIERPGYHSEIGFNSRLDEIQAAVLRIKLRHIEQYNAGRRRVAGEYNRLLAGAPVITPFEDGKGEHIYHQYTILCDDRDRLQERLRQSGVFADIHYRLPIHKQKALAADYANLSLPNAERVASQCLSLPIYPEMPPEQIERVASAVVEALAV
jgi:dTDP-4-amino-4,6-dideoxygalactose transaminase